MCRRSVDELEPLVSEIELNAVVERDDGQRGRGKGGLIEDRPHDVDLVVARRASSRAFSCATMSVP